MPTYDYACAACGHGFERFESIGDDAAKACPKCGKKKARRMLGIGVGVIFKGSGFYTTDSRKSPAGKSDGDAKESDSGSKDSAKADSKDEGKKKKPEGAKAIKKEKESKA